MKVLIKGAGDLATGIAYELWRAGIKVVMTDIAVPLTVRRMVAFSRAVYEGACQVEDARGCLVHNLEEAVRETEEGNVAVIVDEKAEIRKEYQPDVLIDAIMAKRNTGTLICDAPVVIGIGPGFCAGSDCHYVIETKRGAHLGEIIRQGYAIPNTGIPGNVGGYTIERLLKAPADGKIEPIVEIGDVVEKGQIVAFVGKVPVSASLTGILRGMLQKGVVVKEGMKIGDIDVRTEKSLCFTISDKACRIGKSVIEILQTEDFMQKIKQS